MFKMKELAAALAVVITLTSVNFSVLGEEENIYNSEIMPTAEPMLESEDFSELSMDDEIYESDNYTLLEQTDRSLLNDKVNVIYSDEDIFGSGEEKSFDELYIAYAQIITEEEKPVEDLNNYYSENISDTAESAYDILGNYFDDDKISEIEVLNTADEYMTIYKLFACFMESSEVTNEEKAAVRELIMLNHTIIESLNAFMSYRRKIDNEIISSEQENVLEEIASNIFINAEEGNLSENAEIASYSIGNSKDVYDTDIVAPEYYEIQTNNISIDKKSGNLRYTRRDVEIPLESGYMTLDLCYSVNDAQIAAYGYEEWTTSSSPYNNTNFRENPLGAGWRFNLTRIENNILYLKDGRNIQLNGGGKRYNYYKDVAVEYDADTVTGHVVTYLDGSKEYLNSSGLLYKSVDRYGNITVYQYTSINGQYTLLSMASQGKTITIEYNDDSTIINKPGGDKVKYIKSDMNVNYGSLESSSWTRTGKVLSEVDLCNDDEELCDVFFNYTKKEIVTFTGPYNSVHCVDYYVFAAVSEIQGSDGNCYMYDYTSGKINVQGSKTTYNVKVSSKYISEYAAFGMTKYSDVSYEYITSGSAYTKVIEQYTDNKTVVSEFYDTYEKTDVYEKVNNIEILRSSTIISYTKNYEHIPNSNESVIYNRNGNHIETKHDYTYNNYDQLLTDKVYIDSIFDNETDYEYTNNFLTKTIYIRDNNVQCSYYTLRGECGVIITEYATNVDGDAYGYTQYEYDDKYRLILKKTRKELNYEFEYKEYYEYNNNICLPSAVLNKNGNTVLSKTEYTYDADTGKVMTIKDGRNNITSYEYDTRGNITKEIFPNGSSTTITYNADSPAGFPRFYIAQPVTVTYANGYKENYSYSHNGKIKEKSDYLPDFSKSTTLRTIGYDVYGNLISDTDANGNTVTIEYDIFGRQKSVQYPVITGSSSQPVEIYYYDVFFDGSEKCSAVLTVDQTNKASIQYYDVYGQNYKNAMIKNMSDLSATDWENITQLPSDTQLAVTQTNEFNALGRVSKSYDGENRPIEYAYDVYGNVEYKKVGTGNEAYTICYAFNSFGKISAEYLGSNIITHEYDLAGRLIKTTDAMGYTEEYEYDLCNNVSRSKDKNGVYTEYTYDNMNNLIEQSKNGSEIIYTYDNMGRMLTSTNETGTNRYDYNTDGTMFLISRPGNMAVDYYYDSNKNISKIIDCFGNTTNYTYNARNEIASIGEIYHGTDTENVTTYEYNDDGSLAQVNIPNNMTTYYTYDYAGRISYLNNYAPYQTPKAQFTYMYDNSGNITSVQQNMYQSVKTKTYTYDSANRLSYENNGGSYYYYEYDSNNNLISAVGDGDTYYTYDNNNRLIRVSDEWCMGDTEDGSQMDDWIIDYEYDNNGNLLSSSKYSDNYDSNEREYTYNAWGQLTSYSDSLGGSGTYTYCADGLRSSKTVGNDTITYGYNGGDVINEKKNGAEYATNVMGVDGIISRQAGGHTGYYYKDAHGNVVYAFDSGKYRLLQYEYDAWGNEKSWYDWYSDFNQMRYCGEYYDEESGLTYLRGRYYSSEIRRFITEDPAKDGVNWYAYCENNPVMFVDPSGMVAYEHFDSLDEAAEDWAWNYYGTSYYVRYETASLMYMATDEDGNNYYSYTYSVWGDPHSVLPLNAKEFVPENALLLAAIHSHPNTSDGFSSLDYEFSKEHSLRIYVVEGNPNDTHILTYGQTRRGYQEDITKENLVVDKLSQERKEELIDKFKGRWSYHTAIKRNCNCNIINQWPREW